jgi:quercetin dioxygenase-like cupin family protein
LYRSPRSDQTLPAIAPVDIVSAMDFAFFADLAAEVQIPANGILSRTLHQDERLKVLVFGFAKGQELSAHTAPMAASLWFVRGEAKLTLGEESRAAVAGTFVHMPPQLVHSIAATTDVVMLLMLHKPAR